MPRTTPRPAHAVPCARNTPTPPTAPTSTAQLIETLEPRMLLSAVYGYTEARTVDDFVDSIGINIKLDRGVYKNNNNFQNRVLPALTDLEIRHYRDRLINLDNTTYANRYAEILDDTGARMLGLSVPYEEPNASPTKDKNRAKNAPAGVIEAINGPNEPDVFNHPDYNGFTNTDTDYAASRAYQNDLFAAVNNDPATADLPVLTPSMAFWFNVEDIAPADHDIIAGNRYSSFYTTNFLLNDWFADTADWNTGNPIWITEAGHATTPDLNTAGAVSERAQGIYMPRLLTEYFRNGVERTYIHQLLDEGTTPDDDNDNWGLIRADGTFKPSYHAVDNLIDLLNEANFNDTTDQWEAPEFAATPLDYEFLKGSSNGRTPLVLQKSDDTYYLLTFRAENAFSGFDPNNKFDVNLGDSNATLNFADDIESVTHHRYDGTGALNTYSITQNGDNQLVVPLSEEMSIIEVKLKPDDPFQQSSTDGIVSIEAEQYHNQRIAENHSWTIDTSDGSGGAHLDVGPDSGPGYSNYEADAPRLDFKVNFESTGTHYVWVRGRAGGSSAGTSDSVHVGLNDQAVASADKISNFSASSFGWKRSTMDGPIATINVTQTGVQNLNVWMREDGFEFDKIVLTTSSSFTPTGEGPAQSDRFSAPVSETRQAEDGNLGGGALDQSNNPGFNGSGFVNFNSNGGFVEFTNVPGDRTIDLTLRYANGSSSSRTADLKVNGSTVTTLTAAPTGSWSTWATLTQTLTLAPGSNTIRIESTGQDWGNLDQITIDTANPATLQHHFTFEGTNDDQVGGVDASYRNGAALSFNSKVGSQALALDGNNDHVITNDPLAEGDQFTIAAWVYVNPSESNIQGILSNMNGGGSGYLFHVNSWNTTDRRLVFETRNSSGTLDRARTNTNAVVLGQWNHLAAVVDRSIGAVQLYVNGVNQTADSTVRDDFKVNAAAKIGSKGDGSFALGGRIDDLRIYDGLLSTPELAALANA
ncbi:MAG: LamG-like jellyroll fold domain-containing protein [Planctomycetota bacterium]